MQSQSRLAEEGIKAIVKDFEEGLTPAISNIENTDLSENQQNEILEKLDKMEALALQLKAKVENM